jgi:3D (Asp-Asp-Asp) domain-containing protein
MRRAARAAGAPLAVLATLLPAVAPAVVRPPSADLPDPVALPIMPLVGDVPEHVSPPPEHPPHAERPDPVVTPPTPARAPTGPPHLSSLRPRRAARQKIAQVFPPIPRENPVPLAYKPPEGATGTTTRVQSSAYCDSGSTADGSPTVRQGGETVAAWGQAPMGSRWRIVSGPWAGLVVRVADRSSSRFRHRLDVWAASCGEAIRYGAPWIEVESAD